MPDLLKLADELERVLENLPMHSVQSNRLKEAIKALRQIAGR